MRLRRHYRFLDMRRGFGRRDAYHGTADSSGYFTLAFCPQLTPFRYVIDGRGALHNAAPRAPTIMPPSRRLGFLR